MGMLHQIIEFTMGRNMPILHLMEQQKQASFNLQSTVQVFSQDSKLDLTA